MCVPGCFPIGIFESIVFQHPDFSFSRGVADKYAPVVLGLGLLGSRR